MHLYSLLRRTYTITYAKEEMKHPEIDRTHILKKQTEKYNVQPYTSNST
jgi:hypothetical protein